LIEIKDTDGGISPLRPVATGMRRKEDMPFLYGSLSIVGVGFLAILLHYYV
jgi:hypothetical protein